MRKNKRIFMFIFSLTLCLLLTNRVYALEEIPVCENPEVLKVIYFAGIIINIVKIIIPIGLIIMAMMDFSKGVTSNNDGDNKKNLSRLIKRFVYAVIIFIVPWIVKIIIINLGNLTKDVNYTDCLENATSERIAELQPIYDAWVKEQERQGVSGNVKFSDEVKVKIKYDDDIVDNYAAFIGSEAGGNEVGFEAQLMTGAIFMNNLYYDHDNSRSQIVTSPEQINKSTMCTMFSHGNSYGTKKCNYTLDSLKFNEKQKKQLTIAAKLVLSGIFTIPKQVNGQGKMENWGDIAIMWGYTTTTSNCKVSLTHEDGCSQVYSYSKYYTITNEDVYGTTVSTNFDDYKAIADTLYQKYVVEGKEIF